MKKRIALAFSGGGCHIIHWSKLMSILQERDYSVEAVSGNSSGCFLAVLIAAGYTAEEIPQLLQENYANFNKLHFQPKWHRGYGLCTNENIGNGIEKFCTDKGIYTMSDFPFPIILRATDVENGKPVYFTNYLDIPGEKTIKTVDPKTAVMASCAFAGLYKMVEVKDDEGNIILCSDGSERGDCVIRPLKKACPWLDIFACIYKEKEKKPAKHLLGILNRVWLSAMKYITTDEISDADRLLVMERSNKLPVLDMKCKYFDTMQTSGERQIIEMFPEPYDR